MRENLNAAVLAGTLELSPLAPVEPVIALPPVLRYVRGTRAPLDLEADVFRYLIRTDGSIIQITALPQSSGFRYCRSSCEARAAHRRR